LEDKTVQANPLKFNERVRTQKKASYCLLT